MRLRRYGLMACWLSLAAPAMAVALLLPNIANAGQFDNMPLDAKSSVLAQDTFTLLPGQMRASKFTVRSRGQFRVDFALPPGRRVVVSLITPATYEALKQNMRPASAPVMRFTVEGTSSRMATLDVGDYVLVFVLPTPPAPLNIQHRDSFRSF